MKTPIPFTIVYEDEKLVVVNKAAGISVGADRWDPGKERLDRLLAEILSLPKLRPAHRIDMDTSGLVVFTKDEETYRGLSMAFEGRQVGKRYIAVVCGRPAWTETVCDLPLVPNGNKLHHTIIDRYQGKKSLTRFTLEGTAGPYGVVTCRPETGRTHQIRVHLAALGCPIACDAMYGDGRPVLLSGFKKGRRGDPFEERPLLSRLGLHAAALSLPRPGGMLELEAPLPRDMTALINQMKKAGVFR